MDTSDLSHHILSRFNADLEGVRSGVMQMGGLVEQQLQDGIKALYSGDGRLGEEVARLDHRVNAMEVAIDEDCSRILATRGPTASDLRLIVAIIKTITDLERIGDEAEKLGSIASRLATLDRSTDRYARSSTSATWWPTWCMARSTLSHAWIPTPHSRWHARIASWTRNTRRCSASASRS